MYNSWKHFFVYVGTLLELEDKSLHVIYQVEMRGGGNLLLCRTAPVRAWGGGMKQG